MAYSSQSQIVISFLLLILQSSSDSKLKRDLQLSVRDALISKKEESRKDSGADKLSHVDSGDDDEADFDSRMRMQILKKRKELDDLPPKPKMQNGTSFIFHVVHFSYKISTSGLKSVWFYRGIFTSM